MNYDGKGSVTFRGQPTTMQSGETVVLKASAPLKDLHFWSWGLWLFI